MNLTHPSFFEPKQFSGFQDLRTEAIKNLKTISFPTQKDEEWEYTDVKPIFKNNFKFGSGVSLKKQDIEPFLIKNIEVNLIVFVNGFFSEKLSNIINKNEELVVESIARAEKNHPDIFKAHFGKYISTNQDIFTTLNTAYCNDGVFIYVKDKSSIKNPIHLLFLSDTHEFATIAEPRNLIIIGEESKVNLIETYGSLLKKPSFLNTVTEISLQKKAYLNYYKLQDENDSSYQVNNTHIHQDKETRLKNFSITLGGGLIRNNLSVSLDEKHTETHLLGLCFISGTNHVDNHTLISHNKPECISNQMYKGIIADKATSVFNGKIFVEKNAQKTNSFQINKNILLSEKASVNTKPELMIFADDVKCSHGATVGKLDPESIFYLRSRGISEKKARTLLMHGFVNEVLEAISLKELKNNLESRVIKKLEQLLP